MEAPRFHVPSAAGGRSNGLDARECRPAEASGAFRDTLTRALGSGHGSGGGPAGRDVVGLGRTRPRDPASPAEDVGEAGRGPLEGAARGLGGLREGDGGLAGVRAGEGHTVVAPTSSASLVAPRVLVGSGALGAEARILIGDGPLAGAQIHLRAGAGGIEAAILAANPSVRRALGAAVDEAGRRLVRRGLRFRSRDTGDGP